MGRFIEEVETKGFIKDLFLQFQQNLSSEQLKNFANLECDEARYKFVSQNDTIKEFTLTRNATIKNAQLALDFKQKGNKAFQNQQWLAAIDFYNKALLLMPGENCKLTENLSFGIDCSSEKCRFDI